MDVLFFETQKKQIDNDTGYRCRLVSSAREYFKFHYHDYYEIFLSLSDNVPHTVNGKERMLMKGDLVFIRPFDKHFYTATKKEYMFLNFAFDKQTYLELKAFLKSPRFDELETEELPPVAHISNQQIDWINSVYIRLNQIKTDNSAEKRTEFRIFLLKVFERYFIESHNSRKNTPDLTTPVWLSVLYLKLQKIELFSLPFSALVEESGKSKEHLSRSFKKAYGITLSEYQHKLRLNYVANKLVSSTDKVIDIFMEVGYENISWANVLFKKKYGITPSQYRRENTV